MKTSRQQAMLFIAACERPDADDYETHVARMARKWLRILASAHTTQGSVNKLLEHFAEPAPEGYGCLWDELRRDIHAWALAEGWLELESAEASTQSPFRTGYK